MCTFTTTFKHLLFFHIKRVLAKGKQKYVKKLVPLVTGHYLLFSIRGVLTLVFRKSSSHRPVKKKKTHRETVREFNSIRDEIMKILVKSCTRKMDRIGIRSRKPCSARLREGWEYAVSKLRRAVSMNIVVENR